MSGLEVVDAGGDVVQLVDVDGYRVCTFDREPEKEADIVREIKNFNCRHDDVFIIAPPKSGTHWVWEIISMLYEGRAETMQKSKSHQMLEHQTADILEGIKSPRILDSHLDIQHLPKQIFEQRLKIVHVLRNPKDLLVSYYNHVKGILCYGYNGKWENFFSLFLNDELDYGSWFQYVREWEKFIRENPSHPIHVMFYEDLQENSIGEIKRLATFLELEPSEELIHAISEKCKFGNMYKDKMYPDSVRREVYRGDFTMYRKGTVGDWKNWFTVTQNEVFDQHYKQKMAGSNLQFKYTLS
ncbi:sulfotransferase 1A1-like [Mercenaria mercenaria]|uniref:sulfotransferase 1A1-like n=1 Tax=Mercenaria mercenaria TaxID=6596 RepID=UPI00234E7E43|nr:sulfotransferase 1A1-like [Mercenaria mercenaria]